MPLPKLLAMSALLAASMPADVTLRYKTEIKLNPSLPAQLTEQATKAMGSAAPPETVFQLKDGKGASAMGPFRSIVDFSSQQITIIDPDRKRIATATAEQLVGEMTKLVGEMPPEARAAMAAMKGNADSKVTGRTMTIHGIEAEEREVTMTIDGPPVPNLPPGPMIKLGIQFWTAKAGEAERVPALRELAGYNIWTYATMNPAGAIEKMFQQMPGMGEGMGKVMKEMQAAKATLLRSEIKMWMPSIAAMLKQMPAGQSPFGANFDADAPFMEMTQDLAELSNAAVAASVFAVPEGYQTVPAGEIVRGLMPKGQGGK